ncbi:MAG: TerC family protein [Planctomycetes bacterium]|nr:TerC family protein [Planctomycetota bacterium]
MTFDTIGSPLLWGGFILFVLAMLALDLGVFHRKAHTVTVKEAAIWSGVWVALALVFNAGLWWFAGERAALEFTTGYLIEKALSVDNIFVFVVIFSYFAIPQAFQHRVLFWGILGALVLRAIFVLLGGAFLQQFHWAIYVFGGILIVTGVKLLLQRSGQSDPGKNPIIRFVMRFVPVKQDTTCESFFVREKGKLFATPLFLALLAVEFTDVVFAIDSIPAIYAITSDPFLVFTSNIFAILGLRSLYFLLAGVVDKFRYLKVGLAGVLIFVGTKMAIVDVYKVPVGVSLGVIALLLGISVGASMWVTRGSRRDDEAAGTLPSAPTPPGSSGTHGEVGPEPRTTADSRRTNARGESPSEPLAALAPIVRPKPRPDGGLAP